MAYNNIYNRSETYIAGADLSTKQFTFVTSDGDEVTTTGAGLSATGVLWNDPVAADAATVVRGGEPNVYAAEAIAVGDLLASDAAGKAVVATAGDVILGEARSAAGIGGLVTVTFYEVAQSVSA